MQAYSLSQKKLIEVPDSTGAPTQPDVSSDQMRFQAAYKSAQELKDANDIASSYKTAYGADLFGTGTTQKQKDAQVAKDQLKANAKAVIDVLDAGKAGKLKGQAYKDALNSVSSNFAASRAFSEGGKSLTGTELSILQGSNPTIELQKANIIQNAMGVVPPQTGKVLDDEPTLRRKMQMALKMDDPEAAVKELIVSESKRAPEKGLIGLPKKEGDTFSGDVDFAKSLGELATNPQAIAELMKMAYAPMMGPVGIMSQQGNYNKVIDAVKTDAQDFVNDPVGTVTRNPIQSAAMALPVIDAARGLIPAKEAALAGTKTAVKAGEGAAAKTAAKTIVTDALPPIVDNFAKDVQGRIATSVIPAEKGTSVTSAESIAKSLLQSSKSSTTRGIAKEIETNVLPKTGKIIDAEVGKIDKSIGLQPKDEIIAEVIDKIGKSSEARTNPELIAEIHSQLDKELRAYPLEGGPQRGNIYGTSMTDINKARKSLNADTSGWHNSGRPVGTKTNDLNSLKWQASNALKDIMKQADHDNLISDSIDLQHAALEAKGPLSQKALQGSANSGLWNRLFNLAGAIVEPAQVQGARLMQGPGNSVEQMIQKGQLPPLPNEPFVPPQEALPPIVPPAGKATDPKILDTIITGKGEPQGTRYVRDNKGKLVPQGSISKDRKATEKVIEQAKKKKYK